MKQETFMYPGAIKEVLKIIRITKKKKVLLVRGKKSFSLCGAAKILNEYLRDYSVKSFSDFSPNPKSEEIQEGLNLYNYFKPDLVLAVGGGSVIDTAKIINFAGSYSINVLEAINFDNKGKKLFNCPLVAIPTTSGSGSEATHFAVVYHNGIKKSVTHFSIIPSYVIVDPTLTYSMTPFLSAVTALDALSQAIESIWSINASCLSLSFAASSLRIIINNIHASTFFNSKEARINLSYASNLSGKAINITKTTACHSISYPLTALFGIPHGLAVSLSLGQLLTFNEKVSKEDCLDRRGPLEVKNRIKLINNILSVKNSNEGEKKLSNIINSLGVQTRLSDYGVKNKDIEVIVSNAFDPQRMKNNPRMMTESTVRNILVELMNK